MPRLPHRLGRLAALSLVAAALVAACGSAPSPSLSPDASTGGQATPPAGAAGSPAAGLLDVRIADPYTLSDLPASRADAISEGIAKNLGVYAKAVHIGVRQIQQGPVVAAYLMVVLFPPGTLSDSVYAQVVTDLSMGAEQDFATKPISSVPVSFGGMSGGSVALFRTGDLVLIALSPTTADLTPIATALVQANS